tara:strand:- start:4772 stop:6640 length:1869 start_codon:yes stop_codon:yes gene_type:complete
MAVNKDNKSTPSNPAMAEAMKESGAQQSRSTNQTQPSRGRNVEGPKSLAGLNSLFSNPMTRSTAGEVTGELTQTLRKILSSERNSVLEKVTIEPVDGDSHSLALSVIVLQFPFNEHVACYTYIVEGSGDGLADRVPTIAGQQVNIKTVPGDVYDDNMWEQVNMYLRSKYGSERSFIDVGANVIPRTVTADHEKEIRSLLYFGITACYTTLLKINGDASNSISVADINTGDVLAAQLRYNPGDTQTAAGQTVRSDLSIALRGIMQTGEAVSAKQTIPLTTVDGYMDLTYVPRQQQQMAYGQPVDHRQYVPRLVMTNVSSGLSVNTLELELLGLSTTVLAAQHHAWVKCFKPVYGASKNDIHDIGALGFEVDFANNGEYGRISTKSDSFSDQSLFELVQRSMYNEVLFSWDIPETGDLSWLQETFLAAAAGNSKAINTLFNAADTLTGGAFTRNYDGAPPLMSEITRVHLGTYLDENNTLRDLRDLDYLAMLNIYGDKDLGLVEAFGNTYDQTDRPQELRLAERAKIIEATLGDTVTITGYARRVTFNPKFIEALAMACAEAGLKIRPEGIYGNDMGAIRGNTSAVGMGIGQNAGGAVFQQGGANWGGSGMGYGARNSGGLWNR